MASTQNLKVLLRDEIFRKEPKWRAPGGSKYFSMYSMENQPVSVLI